VNIINFIPDWVFYSILGAGIVGLAIARFFPFTYRSLIQAASISLIAIGLFMSGVIHNEKEWKLKLAKLEKDLAEAEAKAAVENVKIVEKVVVKKEYYKTKGNDIIQYVDREIVKYNDRCEIPEEFVIAHDKAAKK
jgi:hypothetical protein